jgi:hypothetical protein
MSAPHFPETAWRKSSFSGANSNCVEIAQTPDLVAARDSKNPTGPTLTVSPTAWTAFVHQVAG